MSGAPPPYQPMAEPKDQPPQYVGPHTGYQAQTTVFVQPQVTLIHQFREAPCPVKCQFCGNEVVTTVMYESGTLTWIACLFIFLLFPFLFFIPFCIDACKDAVHICPNCHNIVGRYNRM